MFQFNSQRQVVVSSKCHKLVAPPWSSFRRTRAAWRLRRSAPLRRDQAPWCGRSQAGCSSRKFRPARSRSGRETLSRPSAGPARRRTEGSIPRIPIWNLFYRRPRWGRQHRTEKVFFIKRFVESKANKSGLSAVSSTGQLIHGTLNSISILWANFPMIKFL